MAEILPSGIVLLRMKTITQEQSVDCPEPSTVRLLVFKEGTKFNRAGRGGLETVTFE